MKRLNTTLVALLILAAFIFVIAAPVSAAVSDKAKKQRTNENEMKSIENRYETEIRNVTITTRIVRQINSRGQVVGESRSVDGSVPSNFTYLFNQWTENTTISEQIDPYFTLVTDFIKDVFLYHNVVYQVSYNTTVTNVQVGGDDDDDDPVILDLNYDKKADVAKNYWLPHKVFYKSHMKFFDLTGDGSLDAIEWVSPDSRDGLLCMPNEEGKVESALELFGTAGSYDDGLHKLSLLFDKDKNGWVEGEELKGIAIWIDKNADGISDDGEIKPLSEFRIKRISTVHNPSFVGKYETTDGETHLLWNWWPKTSQTVRAFSRK